MTTVHDSAERGHRAGFTLVELMVGLALSALVIVGMHAALWACSSKWEMAKAYMRVHYEDSYTLQRMVYGPAGGGGLREASGMAVSVGTNGWTICYTNADLVARYYRYDRAQGHIVSDPGGILICSGVTDSAVATSTNASGVDVRVDLREQACGYALSRSLTTFIGFRNVARN